MRVPQLRTRLTSAAPWVAAVGAGSVAAIVAVVWPVFGAHADPPPGIPMTLYGTASGAVPGQRVIAMVIDGTSLRACSDDPAYDMVLTSEGRTVYRVSVNSDQTKTGCGAPGRQVFLYFAPITGVDGRAATATVPWQGTGSQGTVYEANVTVTSPLSNKGFVPVAKDGTN
jgi:hypothetical protein